LADETRNETTIRSETTREAPSPSGTTAAGSASTGPRVVETPPHRALQAERMGHEVPGMRAVYSHIPDEWRKDLVSGL
jgi:hypothetical protein